MLMVLDFLNTKGQKMIYNIYRYFLMMMIESNKNK